MRKIVIAGADGFLGKYLGRWFLVGVWEVVGLTRHAGVEGDLAGRLETAATGGGLREVFWDGRSLGAWAEEMNGAEVVVNLAGKSVNCRYGEKNRAAIFQSRLESTAVIGEAIRSCEIPPRVWLNSSTATIYRDETERPNDEKTGVLGEGFSVEVAKAWEKALRDSEVPKGTRKVAMRTAIVFGNEPGSVFDYLRKISALGLGRRMGSGRQKVSWVHVKDFCRAVEWLAGPREVADFYNVVSPNATDNAGMMSAFRRMAGRGFGLPAARWMLEVGTFLMRSETELVLKSRWVVPGRLEAEGFEFEFTEFDAALRDLAGKPGFGCLE